MPTVTIPEQASSCAPQLSCEHHSGRTAMHDVQLLLLLTLGWLSGSGLIWTLTMKENTTVLHHGVLCIRSSWGLLQFSPLYYAGIPQEDYHSTRWSECSPYLSPGL